MSEQSETLGKLFDALSKAQAEMEDAKKDSVNPHFKSRYADLASVRAATKGPLAKHGLCVVQTTRPAENGIHVVTTLGHVSGEWMRGELFMPAAKQDPQGFGSAMKYARRYAWEAIVGLAADDDDGEGATRGPVKAAPAPAPGQANGSTFMATAIADLVKAKAAKDFNALAASINGALANGLITGAQRAELIGEINAAIARLKAANNGKAATA